MSKESCSNVYTFFDRKTSSARANKVFGSDIKNENMSHKKLAEELHKLLSI